MQLSVFLCVCMVIVLALNVVVVKLDGQDELAREVY